MPIAYDIILSNTYIKAPSIIIASLAVCNFLLCKLLFSK